MKKLLVSFTISKPIFNFEWRNIKIIFITKNLFITLALILFCSFSFANNSDEKHFVNNFSKTVIDNNERISLTLNLGDITNSTKAEINEKVDSFLSKALDTEDQALDCSVTVTGSVTVGVATFEISVTVSGTCEEIAAAGSRIANQVLTQVKEYIKDNL